MIDSRFQISNCRLTAGVFVLALLLSVPVFSHPQQPSAPISPAAQDGFVPMSELAPREVLPATPLVFYAYGFVWIALLGYVFSIWRRMGRVEQDLADVQRRLQAGRGGR